MNKIVVAFLCALYGFVCTSDDDLVSSCSSLTNDSELIALVRDVDSPSYIFERPQSCLVVDEEVDKNESLQLKSCLKSNSIICRSYQEPVLEYFTPEQYASYQSECIVNKVINSRFSQKTFDLKERFKIEREESLLKEWIKSKKGTVPAVRPDVWSNVIHTESMSCEELGFVEKELAKVLDIMQGGHEK